MTSSGKKKVEGRRRVRINDDEMKQTSKDEKESRQNPGRCSSLLTAHRPFSSFRGGPSRHHSHRGAPAGGWPWRIILIVSACTNVIWEEDLKRILWGGDMTRIPTVVSAWPGPWATTSLTNRKSALNRPPALFSSSSSTTASSSSSEKSSSSSSTGPPPREPTLNPLLQVIRPSTTVQIFSKVKQMEALEPDNPVTSLCVGEPDFDVPAPIGQALVQALERGETRYTAVSGTAALRQAVVDDWWRRKQVKYDAQTEVVVANGAKQAVYQGLLATVGPGDAVLVPAPYWTSYPDMVRLVGAEPIIVSTTPQSQYLLTAQQLRDTLQQYPHIKMLILCNPSNPTGSVYDETALQGLAQVLKEFPHVWILADEIYERLLYPTSEASSLSPEEQLDHSRRGCPSMAAQPGLWARTLTVHGFSKTYAMTGLRLGYLLAPKPVATAVATLQSQLTSCASSLAQAAGIAALQQVTDADLQDIVRQMQVKRDLVWQELSTMPGVQLPSQPPAGAFYIMATLPDTVQYGQDDTQLCLDLLQQERLALVPGSAFGAPGTVRLSYATDEETLRTAMTKLRRFLQDLPRINESLSSSS